MRRWRKAGVVGASGLAMVGALAACGDPITANRDFRAFTALVTVTQNAGNATEEGKLLTGPLVDASQKPIAGTHFQEECVRVTVSGKTSNYRCLAFLNAGRRLYVTIGETDGVFSTLKSLSAKSPKATMTIRKISGGDSAKKPLLLRLSLRTG